MTERPSRQPNRPRRLRRLARAFPIWRRRVSPDGQSSSDDRSVAGQSGQDQSIENHPAEDRPIGDAFYEGSARSDTSTDSLSIVADDFEILLTEGGPNAESAFGDLVAAHLVDLALRDIDVSDRPQ